MSTITIHVMHTGQVSVAPDLPFGGSETNILKASGLFTKKEDRLWLPVSTYLIEHPKGLVLVDTGWHREMSPNGVFDKAAQVKSLGSSLLYRINQGVLPHGQAVDEQLARMGIKPSDLDYVLLTHLDCDHANGLSQVADAKKILASKTELEFTKKGLMNHIRYQEKWWKDVPVTFFNWNGSEGPVGKSYDVFGDGSLVCVNILGHAEGMFAVKVRNAEGKFVLLYADGGYASKSWQEMILPGVVDDKTALIHSLEWIREQSLDPNCLISLANHDINIEPQMITL
ncbi:N-acyl homoserine lactonase family protein [Streptococcus pneumoniae]